MLTVQTIEMMIKKAKEKLPDGPCGMDEKQLPWAWVIVLGKNLLKVLEHELSKE